MHQRGVERVDSYTFNPHKWLFTNFDCNVLWWADRAPLLDTLSDTPPYLRDAAPTPASATCATGRSRSGAASAR